MDLLKASEILAALANGHDPKTGEVLGQDNLIYLQPDINSALSIAIAVLRHEADKSNRQETQHRAGHPWNSQEDEALRSSFHLGIPLRDLAQRHQRTPGAITARLIRHGLLEPDGTQPK